MEALAWDLWRVWWRIWSSCSLSNDDGKFWRRGKRMASRRMAVEFEGRNRNFWVFIFWYLIEFPSGNFWLESKGPTISSTCSAKWGRRIWNLGWKCTSICVPGLQFQFLAFPCTRQGPFSKICNIYIKTLITKPWAWFRGLFCLTIICTQNDNF